MSNSTQKIQTRGDYKPEYFPTPIPADEISGYLARVYALILSWNGLEQTPDTQDEDKGGS